jgi:hypothetical protein
LEKQEGGDSVSNVKRKLVVAWARQACFDGKGGLNMQAFLLRWIRVEEDSVKQVTLEKWLYASSSIIQKGRKDSNESQLNSSKGISGAYAKFPETVSCIELTMKHDKRGNVIGWMEGEPRVDSWDGSLDNQQKALENHVSKHGWQF